MIAGVRGRGQGARVQGPGARDWVTRTALVLAGTAIACGRGGPGPNPQEPAGRVDVEWVRFGDTTGPVPFGGPAQARWCAGDSLLTVTAVRHDSAIGLLLLAADASVSGLGRGYYAVMPARVFIPWRPRAIAALRLVEAVAVRNYESGSGQVTVTQSGDRISGTLDLRLVASTGEDSLRVQGSFSGLRPIPEPPPCGRTDKPPMILPPSPPPPPPPPPAAPPAPPSDRQIA
ncbi:MAG: hypothetical protein ACT4PM_10980 [Gemmatimonadales bacterium]